MPGRSAHEYEGFAPLPHLRDGDAIAIPGDSGFQGGLAEAVQVSWLALLQLAVLGHLYPLGYGWVQREARGYAGLLTTTLASTSTDQTGSVQPANGTLQPSHDTCLSVSVR